MESLPTLLCPLKLPGQLRVLGGDHDSRSPVSPMLNQASDPATEPILLVAKVCHHRASPEQQQRAQIRDSRLGNAAQPLFAAAAMLSPASG